MPALSLSSMARRACIKNIRSITDVGDTPYDVVRPVLIKIENPEQLRQIEEASPQIIGRDAEIWMELIKRDVQDWDKKPHEPRNPENWHKVYKKLVRDSQRQISKDAQLLKATMDGISNERSKHRIERVELDFVKLPGDMTRSGPTISVDHMIKFTDRGTLHDKPPSKREIQIGLGKLDPNAPRKTAPKNGLLDKFRKEAKAMPRFPQQPKKPTGVIAAREMALKPKPTNTTIKKAPQGMIEEYRQASVAKPIDPTVKPPPIFNPKKRKIEHDDDPRTAVKTTEEREKRLKAFTTPSSTIRPTTAIKVPRSRPSTPMGRSPASSPPNTEPTQLAKSGLSTSLPQPHVTPSTSPPLNAVSRASPAPHLALARSNTSSPINGGSRPQMKRKAPVDIFMKPNKKRRPS